MQPSRSWRRESGKALAIAWAAPLEAIPVADKQNLCFIVVESSSNMSVTYDDDKCLFLYRKTMRMVRRPLRHVAPVQHQWVAPAPDYPLLARN